MLTFRNFRLQNPGMTQANQRVPNWGAVWNAAKARSRLDPMSIHGPGHWRNVEANGIELVAQTPGGDETLVRLFAVLHDCERETEGYEPTHGPAAARTAKEWNGRYFHLPADDLALLMLACERHERGEISDDPTVGCCWDADRLDLPRVGVTPRIEYMSTDYGRRRTE